MEPSDTEKTSASTADDRAGSTNQFCKHHQGIVIDDGDAVLLENENGTVPVDFKNRHSTDLIRDEFPQLPQLTENAAAGCQMCAACRTSLLQNKSLKGKFEGIFSLQWELVWDEHFALYPGKGRFRLNVSALFGVGGKL